MGALSRRLISMCSLCLDWVKLVHHIGDGSSKFFEHQTRYIHIHELGFIA